MNVYQSRVPAQCKYLDVVLTTGQATQVATETIWVKAVWLYGYSATSATGAPTNNSATAYAGFADADGTLKMVQSIDPGKSLQVYIPDGMVRNISELYVTGTTGDRVLVEYIEE